MEIFKSIVANVLTALYQSFWFAVLLTIFILFFYIDLRDIINFLNIGSKN